MKRSLLVLALCGSFLALGAEADKSNEPPDSFHNVEGDRVSKHEDTATFILNHVSDSEEMEFDIPLAEHGAAPTIHFPMWRIPLHEGACPASEHEVASLNQGCVDISLTKHSFMMLVASALLIIALLAFSHRDRNQPVPKGSAANIIELLVLFVRDEIAIANIGKEEGPRYTPYLLSIFFFILAINLLGLIPWMATATGNVAVTLALAACTFLLTQVASIRAAGFGGYLKHLTGGVPPYLWIIMIPVELLGLFTKPFALTLRLFANMLAGHIVLFSLLGLIMILQQPAVAIGAVPFAVAIYLLELFVAFLQAYVFTLLSSIFIGMGVAMGHHEGDHGPEGSGHAEHGHAAHEHA